MIDFNWFYIKMYQHILNSIKLRQINWISEILLFLFSTLPDKRFSGLEHGWSIVKIDAPAQNKAGAFLRFSIDFNWFYIKMYQRILKNIKLIQINWTSEILLSLFSTLPDNAASQRFVFTENVFYRFCLTIFGTFC